MSAEIVTQKSGQVTHIRLVTWDFCITCDFQNPILTFPTHSIFTVLPWCPNWPKTSKSTRFILVVIVLGIYNFGHQVFLSCLDKFNGDLPLVYDLTLGLCYQSVAAAPPVAHFHRQLNLIRVANTQLITLNLISCIMHRKLVKPLLGFILHDKALNYICYCFMVFLYSQISMQCRRYGIYFLILAILIFEIEINFANQSSLLFCFGSFALK